MLELSSKAGKIIFSNNEIQQKAPCFTVQCHSLWSLFCMYRMGFFGVLLSMSINMDIALSKAVQVGINDHSILNVSFNALPLDCLIEERDHGVYLSFCCCNTHLREHFSNQNQRNSLTLLGTEAMTYHWFSPSQRLL